MNGTLYLVEDSDGGGAEYSHLFLLPPDLTPEMADLILEREMAVLHEDFIDWNWDDAIRVLTRFGWTHLDFTVASATY